MITLQCIIEPQIQTNFFYFAHFNVHTYARIYAHWSDSSWILAHTVCRHNPTQNIECTDSHVMLLHASIMQTRYRMVRLQTQPLPLSSSSSSSFVGLCVCYSLIAFAIDTEAALLFQPYIHIHIASALLHSRLFDRSFCLWECSKNSS